MSSSPPRIYTPLSAAPDRPLDWPPSTARCRRWLWARPAPPARVRNEPGEVLYRQCEQPAHHHHLVCRSCGLTQEVAAPGVEKWARAVAQEYGYVDLDHQVELFGVCAGCAAKR